MMIDLNDMCEQAYEISIKRENNGGKVDSSTLGLCKHCATEVVEMTAAFHSNTCPFDSCVSELADVIMVCLIIAGKYKIDIETALNKTMEKNRRRAEKQGDKL